MLIFLLLSTVQSEPLVDTTQFQNLKKSSFESHSTGWMGLDGQWLYRIYVGNSEMDIDNWFLEMQKHYYKIEFQDEMAQDQMDNMDGPPLETNRNSTNQTQPTKTQLIDNNSVDTSWNHLYKGSDVYMGNIGHLAFLCQGGDSTRCMDQLRNRVEDVANSTCPSPIVVTTLDGNHHVSLTQGSCRLNFEGGTPVIYTDEAIVFKTLPNAMVLYNSYAQSWKWFLTEENQYALRNNTQETVDTPVVQPDQ